MVPNFICLEYNVEFQSKRGLRSRKQKGRAQEEFPRVSTDSEVTNRGVITDNDWDRRQE